MIDRVQRISPVYKAPMNIYKEREMQNQEKMKKLVETKTFLEEFRNAQESSKNKELVRKRCK